MRVAFNSSEGNFNFQLNATKVGRLDLMAIDQTAHRGFVATQADDREEYLVELPVFGVTEIQTDGYDVIAPAGQAAVIASPGRSVTWKDAGLPYQAILLKIDKALMESKLRALLGSEDDTPVVFHPRIDTTRARGQSLCRLIDNLVYCVENVGAITSHPASAAAYEDLILTALLTEFEHSRLEEFSRPAGGNDHRPIKRVEEYFRAHSDDGITIEDIAYVAGVSVRSLQRMFREQLETTPMKLLKEIRLEKARERLLFASGGRSVTDVAMSSGFGHLGAFGADYRKRFGESPKDTLARAKNA